jgi:hypothetical protein
MSLVLSILLVLGLFALLGLVAWAAVTQVPASLLQLVSRPSGLKTPLDESRELVGQHAG